MHARQRHKTRSALIQLNERFPSHGSLYRHLTGNSEGDCPAVVHVQDEKTRSHDQEEEDKRWQDDRFYLCPESVLSTPPPLLPINEFKIDIALEEAKRTAAYANEHAVKKAAFEESWFVPHWSRRTRLLVAFAILVFVLATAAFFWWHELFSDDVYLYWGLYGRGFAAVFAIVAFYFLMDNAAIYYDQQRTISGDTTSQQIVLFLGSLWPLSARLQRQLFPCNPLLEPAIIPNDLNPNLVRLVEEQVYDFIIQNIDNGIRQQPVQTRGNDNLWRGWFTHSPLLREAWAYRRHTVVEQTMAFIDQELMPGGMRRKVTCCARALINPLRFTAWIITLIVILLSIVYWIWLVGKLPPGRLDKTSLFVDLLAAFYVSAVLITLVADAVATNDDISFNYENTRIDAADSSVVTNYPDSIPFYRQFVLGNKMVQAGIHLPEAGSNPSRIRNFAFIASRSFFIAVATQLRLEMPPHPDRVRVWRENFCNCFIREQWPIARPDFADDEAEYMTRELYNKASFVRLETPPLR